MVVRAADCRPYIQYDGERHHRSPADARPEDYIGERPKQHAVGLW